MDERGPAHGRGVELRRGRLTLSQRRQGGRIAGEVFSNDGLFFLLFPNEHLRIHGINQLHRGLLAAIPRTTTITRAVERNKLLGCSLWVPPGGWPYPESFYRRSGRQTHKLVTSCELAVDVAEPFLTEVASNHLHEPHWYLQLLMVDRPRQGSGIGKQLLQPGLNAADREGVPCMLETQAERNLAYYERFGFKVTAITADSTNTATMWTMVRQPR